MEKDERFCWCCGAGPREWMECESPYCCIVDPRDIALWFWSCDA